MRMVLAIHLPIACHAGGKQSISMVTVTWTHEAQLIGDGCRTTENVFADRPWVILLDARGMRWDSFRARPILQM
jgi:hypothetical protein